MKKLVVFCVVGLASLVFAFTGDYDLLQTSVTESEAGNVWYQAQDSSDTFRVDTLLSTVIDIGDYKWVNINAQIIGFTLADSCNDSVPVMVKAYGTYDNMNHTKRTLLSDSLNATPGALDSAVAYNWIIRVDSVGLNKLYFETVISDSFIAGEAETSNDDSSRFQFMYTVTQTGTK